MSAELRDLDRAKALLAEGGHSVVLCRGGDVIARDGRGIGPLIDLIASGTGLDGYSAADRVGGKAAALLYARAGVIEVYAPLMSATGVRTFQRHGIAAQWERLTGAILDRSRTGPCPMERVVAHIDDPDTAYDRLRAEIEARRAAPATTQR